MAIYKLGSRGDEVREIQRKLAALGDYRGPIDGDFGGGTQAAVVAFQRRKGVDPDGSVGDRTWEALFGSPIPKPAIGSENLVYRCLALTGSFETGTGIPDCFCGISGDFDGQGISFGVLQWNFGQGSLQPLIKDMIERHPDVIGPIFGNHFDAFAEALHADKDELLGFARSVQHPVTRAVFEPWRGYAKTLGRTPEFQAIETEYAGGIYRRALAMCQDYGLWSERAVALMFDIVTQNGSIDKVTRARILGEIKALPASLSDEERETRKMVIVANRRAEAANPRWIDDVRVRKLCIARGEGTVHGIPYRLDDQYAIGLSKFAA
ncbi:MAG: peptidoglycan-binding domain 1 protein [Proteobacteria bacterium]|nr:peptidoglycan-binding domain 1 protein [Pseudomonadota bacterium]